jgi:fermentation-respiration switch protein FrsA (DUF1100 family)
VWLPVLAGLHAARIAVLAIDYRGYGLSTGTPSEEGLYRDAEAAVRHAVAARTSARPRPPLVFWGRSLGGPVAAAATRVAAPDGVILESTFIDKAAVVRSHPLLRALNVFARYRFPTLEMLGTFAGPVLVIHGTRDSVIPYALGRELYERLRSPRQFLELPGTDHNDLIGPEREAYWQPIGRFLASLPSD